MNVNDLRTEIALEGVFVRLGRIEKLLIYILRKEELNTMASKTVADALTNLQAQVANDTSVVTSAETLINGIPGLIKTAVDQAIAAGATPEQLQAFDDLGTQISNNATGLAASVTAGTPSAPAAT